MLVSVFSAWFVLSILIGWWNKSRGNLFLPGFLVSLLFTPVAGALFVSTTMQDARCSFCSELMNRGDCLSGHCARPDEIPFPVRRDVEYKEV